MQKISEGQLLWQPGQTFIERANITALQSWLRTERGLEFADYDALWRWSISDLSGFWQAIWDYFNVQSPTPYTTVLTSHEMPGAHWFPGAQVNFAEHLLQQGAPEAIAIYAESETRQPVQLSWRELNSQVVKLATALRELGVQPGDRVVAYLPNTPEAAVALLAVTAIGAVWSACSPDFGIKSVLDRFQQIEPKVLFAVDGYRYGGKAFDRRDQVRRIAAELSSLEHIIHLPYLFADDDQLPLPNTSRFSDLIDADKPEPADFKFASVPFDHPLWVVYSSGTTGLPKGIVHGHGGILLEQLKFQTFHNNLGPDSCKFFYTTTGWVMFNLVLSGLLTSSAIVLYDGNPAYPDLQTLWRFAEKYRVTYFGTSPTFINTMMQHQLMPRQHFDLSALNTIVCTGSPATPEIFAWFYENVKTEVWVAPLSGGTDVCAPFVGGVPTLPVQAGLMQAPCLGVNVQAFDDNGNAVVDEVGELVVTEPMPSMPLYFWNDQDNHRYLDSYFSIYPGLWRHGDLLKMTAENTCAVYGRSDSTLNRYGIRIGTSEIYRTLEALPEIEDSLIVNLELPGARFFMPLFVVLKPGFELDEGLRQKINAELRNTYSPRHAPDKIYQIDAVPYTLTGKKQEVPVKRILTGTAPEKAVNLDAMANPEAIGFFIEFYKGSADYKI